MAQNIWLTGSRGFVGTYTKEFLSSLGYNLTLISQSDGEFLEVLDFSKPKEINNLIKKVGLPETFIHLGWGNVYEPHHSIHISENLEEGKNLINTLFKAGLKRFISVGSSSEYGDLQGSLEESLILPEPSNNYIKGKTALCDFGNQMAEEYQSISIHTRLYYAYGAGQKHNSLINQLFKSAEDGQNMDLSPCEHYRDYIYIEDVAQGLEKICNVNKSGIINLGAGKVIQLKDFVLKFWEMLDSDPKKLNFGSHEVPESEQSQPKSYANLKRLKDLTGWTPQTSIESGIEKTIALLQLQ